jgi:hypothetical protein
MTDAPGSFDTSEAVNITTTMEEATEAGYLGVSFDDSDLTVAGVTAGSTAKAASAPSPSKAEKAEPEHKSRRGE